MYSRSITITCNLIGTQIPKMGGKAHLISYYILIIAMNECSRRQVYFYTFFINPMVAFNSFTLHILPLYKFTMYVGA